MKQSLLLSTLALALLIPGLQGCVPAVIATGAAVGVMSIQDRRSTGTQTDDETTEWRAKAYIPEQYRNTSHINITAYNRRVLLTGEVPNATAKADIEAQMRRLEGVREVYNELGIGPVSSLSDRSTDSFIDSKVKARLVDSKQLSANHIKVVTERGITHLMGIVNDREARIATTIASTTSGVRKVVNILEILPDSETRRLDAQAGGSSRNAAAVVAPIENR